MSGYRPPYTTEEQKKILRFIIDTKEYHNLRGRRFWQEMEEAKVVDRTWQSVKEHFVKQVYPQLNNPKFQLSDEEINLIKTGYTESSKPNPKKTNINESTLDNTNRHSVDLASIIDSSDEEL